MGLNGVVKLKLLQYKGVVNEYDFDHAQRMLQADEKQMLFKIAQPKKYAFKNGELIKLSRIHKEET